MFMYTATLWAESSILSWTDASHDSAFADPVAQTGLPRPAQLLTSPRLVRAQAAATMRAAAAAKTRAEAAAAEKSGKMLENKNSIIGIR